SKFIHTWLRFGEIMRGSLSATQAFVIYALGKYEEQGVSNVIFSCLKATPKRRMNGHSVISFFYLLIFS
ncbi:hypothetical protein M3I61_18485, partial [Escherichia coli]